MESMDNFKLNKIVSRINGTLVDLLQTLFPDLIRDLYPSSFSQSALIEVVVGGFIDCKVSYKRDMILSLPAKSLRQLSIQEG